MSDVRRLSDTDKANAPQTSQEAARIGYDLQAEGRSIIDDLNRFSVLHAKAERWLSEEEAIAAEVEGFAGRRTNEDERAWATGKHPIKSKSSEVAWLVRAVESAGLDGLEEERVETIADLRLVVKLLKSAVTVAEKRLRVWDGASRHQSSVTSWAKSEYGGVMDGRMDDAPRAPHPAEVA